MSTISLQSTRNFKLFSLWWTLAGLAGFVVGMTLKTLVEIIAGITGQSAVLESIPAPLFGTFLGLMLGVSIGFFQWLVLRRSLKNSSAWISGTVFAYTLFWTLHNAGAFGWAHTPWGLVGQGFGHGAILGATIGFVQYFVLRSLVYSARRWIITMLVSWSLAGAIMHFLLDVAFASFNIHGPFDILISTLLASLFSSFALERLVREPRATMPASEEYLH
jgi:hypothetical protein